MIEARFEIRRGGFELSAALNIEERGVTALFGPSGCGKTTLLRAIAGLDRHPNARLKVGDDVWQDTGTFCPPHRRGVGYVFQEPSLFPHLTVRGNLEYGRRRIPVGAEKVSVDQTVSLLGLEPLLPRKPHSLSGGERQRVAIARALAASPRLLLMDEPLAALDRERKQEILPYIASLRGELDIPVIYVSHSADEVARLADFLVLLDAGKVAGSGPIGEMLTRLDLPLARGDDAEALIEAVVAGHDEVFHLTYLDFPGGRFTVPRKALAAGSVVRLRVAARDVSLTLTRQENTSILNIFPATVEALAPEGEAQVVVRLLSSGVPMLSRITRKSAATLGLEPGKQVFAQAKSVALLA